MQKSEKQQLAIVSVGKTTDEHALVVDQLKYPRLNYDCCINPFGVDCSVNNERRVFVTATMH